MGKTVLVIGSGGREHALAWKLSGSPQVSRVIVAPGNDGMVSDGMAPEWERWKASLSGRGDFQELAKKARAAHVDLVVVGPDNPLADGIVDVFEEHGLLCFGPRAAAAKIEASKTFAKEVMLAAGVPTAKHAVASSIEEARAVLRAAEWSAGGGWVIKADGLALGKGVYVCSSPAEAETALESIARSGLRPQFVIEEKLSGEEISWMAFCDGSRCALLEPARDYKRVADRDQGPNTGGMGAMSPVPGVPASFAEEIRAKVFLPTLAEMSRRGSPFRGVLYAGLMVDFARGKFWVLEFNARFGDPEAQVLMARMEDDLFKWCEAVARGDVSRFPSTVPFSKDAAVVVVAAARGYPEAPAKGDVIAMKQGETSRGKTLRYFLAGVSKDAKGACVTAGGRVLGAMGTGATLADARAEAYANVREVSFDGMHFRTDIAEAR